MAPESLVAGETSTSPIGSSPPISPHEENNKNTNTNSLHIAPAEQQRVSTDSGRASGQGKQGFDLASVDSRNSIAPEPMRLSALNIPNNNNNNNVKAGANTNLNAITSIDTNPGASVRDGEQVQAIPSSSILYSPVPLTSNPTDILANRFQAYRTIIKSLSTYLGAYASHLEEISRVSARLDAASRLPDFGDGVVFQEPGRGGLLDVTAGLRNFHRNQATSASKLAYDITHSIVPRLEELRRDLYVKIKEIRSLSGDFKNNVSKEKATGQREVNSLGHAIELASVNPQLLTPKNDPYLCKQTVDNQLARIVDEESYLTEAYLNLQSSGRQLECVVVQEIQTAMGVVARYLSADAQNLLSAVKQTETGFISMDPFSEWDYFIQHDERHFVDPSKPIRHLGDIVYGGMDNPVTKQVRAGYLDRRSKYLKSYSKAWYVLTCTFLHEFKSADRKKDPIPVMSLALSDCSISKPHSESSNNNKFVLNAKTPSGMIHRSHNWVFRAANSQEMEGWFNDIQRLALRKSIGEENIIQPTDTGYTSLTVSSTATTGHQGPRQSSELKSASIGRRSGELRSASMRRPSSESKSTSVGRQSINGEKLSEEENNPNKAASIKDIGETTPVDKRRPIVPSAISSGQVSSAGVVHAEGIAEKKHPSSDEEKESSSEEEEEEEGKEASKPKEDDFGARSEEEEEVGQESKPKAVDFGAGDAITEIDQELPGNFPS